MVGAFIFTGHDRDDGLMDGGDFADLKVIRRPHGPDQKHSQDQQSPTRVQLLDLSGLMVDDAPIVHAGYNIIGLVLMRGSNE